LYSPKNVRRQKNLRVEIVTASCLRIVDQVWDHGIG
jgi:hypothetical protein